MRLLKKWMLISLGGGLLLIVVLYQFIDVLPLDAQNSPAPLDAVVEIVLWPVPAFMQLVDFLLPPPNIGPPEKHWHEGTPVTLLAFVVGIGLTWVFYSSLGFLIVWFRRRRAARATVS